VGALLRDSEETVDVGGAQGVHDDARLAKELS
jgi:hypothetical protein